MQYWMRTAQLYRVNHVWRLVDLDECSEIWLVELVLHEVSLAMLIKCSNDKVIGIVSLAKHLCACGVMRWGEVNERYTIKSLTRDELKWIEHDTQAITRRTSSSEAYSVLRLMAKLMLVCWKSLTTSTMYCRQCSTSERKEEREEWSNEEKEREEGK